MANLHLLQPKRKQGRAISRRLQKTIKYRNCIFYFFYLYEGTPEFFLDHEGGQEKSITTVVLQVFNLIMNVCFPLAMQGRSPK